ncbi:MAG: hypothetical protein Q7R58_01145 [bacterium]|nr:hypothetical protein [bacterium]
MKIYTKDFILEVDYQKDLSSMIAAAGLNLPYAQHTHWAKEVKKRGGWERRYGYDWEWEDRGYYCEGFYLPKDKGLETVGVSLVELDFEGILNEGDKPHEYAETIKNQELRFATIEELLHFAKSFPEELYNDVHIHALGTESYITGNSSMARPKENGIPREGLAHPFVWGYAHHGAPPTLVLNVERTGAWWCEKTYASKNKMLCIKL